MKFSNYFAMSLLAIAGLSLPSYADDEQPDDRIVHFVLSAGLTYGGETLIGMVDEPGASGTLSAGGTFEAGLGLLYSPRQIPVSLQLTTNVHVDGLAGSNGSATFIRLPVEGTVFYNGLKDWRFGLGARYVRDAHGTGTVDSKPLRLDFKTSVSPFVQAGYEMTDNMWVDLRWVHEDLKLKAPGQSYDGLKVNANHTGIFFTGGF